MPMPSAVIPVSPVTPSKVMGCLKRFNELSTEPAGMGLASRPYVPRCGSATLDRRPRCIFVAASRQTVHTLPFLLLAPGLWLAVGSGWLACSGSCVKLLRPDLPAGFLSAMGIRAFGLSVSITLSAYERFIF